MHFAYKIKFIIAVICYQNLSRSFNQIFSIRLLIAFSYFKHFIGDF